MNSRSHFFRSTRFTVEPGEDQDTNPCCYGIRLADWLKDRLCEKGWSPEDIVAEDWGRCLMIHYKPYMLWVACSNVRPDVELNPEYLDERYIPEPSKIIWSVFVSRDLFFWNINFWRRSNADAELSRLECDLESILKSEPTIEFVESP